MKRYFEVNKQYFATKAEAKAARGPRLDDGTGAPRYAHVITRGPDHWKNA